MKSILAVLVLLNLSACALAPRKPDSENTKQIEEIKTAMLSQEFDKARQILRSLREDDGLVTYELSMFGWSPETTYFPKSILLEYIGEFEPLPSNLEKVCGLLTDAKNSQEVKRSIDCLKAVNTAKLSGKWDYQHNPKYNHKTYYWGISSGPCGNSSQRPTCSPLGTFVVEDAISLKKIEGVGAEGFLKAIRESRLKEAYAKLDIIRKDEEERQDLEFSEKQRANIEFTESAEGLRQSACRHNTIIQLAEKSLNDEKEAAKISGFVDKSTMYESGKYLQNSRRQLESLKKKYKSKSGQEWSSSMCAK
ncbi:MAG: hypothetical protein HUU57_01855 [Bdellovibrio sp.]|nr:hypothetical protein [Bdellovibrio sp.]